MQTKDQIRQRVWHALQKQRVARFPGAEGRIPNFTGAEACAKQLAETRSWKAARFLKVNPDSPQRAIRQRALTDGKVIYMAVDRKSTRLNSSHGYISYAVFCLKKKTNKKLS